MKTSKLLMIPILLLLPSAYCHPQHLSIASKLESDEIVRKTIEAGFLSSEQFKASNSPIYYSKYLMACNELKKSNVGVFKMYIYNLNRKIESYDFADSINQYISCDTSRYLAYFYRNIGGKNRIFGYTRKSKNGTDWEPIQESFDDVPEFDFFVNYQDRYKSNVIYAAWKYFIIKNNCMYIIEEDDIQKASVYFKAHSAEFPLKAFESVFIINFQ